MGIFTLTRSAILSPTKPYEFNGVLPNVVFPDGTVALFEKDEICVYYGCADTSIGLGSGGLGESVALCKAELK